MTRQAPYWSGSAAILVGWLVSNVSSPATAQQAQPAPASTAPDAASATLAQGGDLGDLESVLGESVVTTASRSSERASTAPSTVYTITAGEMRIFGIRTFDEALGFLGLGVYTASARDYTAGIDVGAQGVLIRDRGRHILALLDGHVMNSQVHGGVSLNEALGVPLEAVDHIEVMLGAGSVMYGSNAMLLVVNVVTHSARDQRGVHMIAELGTSAPNDGTHVVGSGGDQSFGARYRLGASGAATFGEDADVAIYAEWLSELSNTYHIDPITEGTGSISFRPDQTAWGGQADHRLIAPSGVMRARYRHFQLTVQANHYERTMPLVGIFEDPTSIEKQDALRFDLRHSIDLSARATLGSRLYADYSRFSEASAYGESFWCIEGQLLGCRFKSRASARWLGLEEQLVLDWLLDGTVATTLGFDLRGRSTDVAPAEYRDIVTGVVSTTVTTPHSERTGFLGALFAQQVWKPAHWLTLNLGARLDADTDFGARVSPRAAVAFEPADGTAIRTGYSEAFRGPTPFELDEFDPTYRIAPVSLKPEVVRSVEVEWQQRLALVTFSLRGFGSLYENFIDSRSVTEDEYAAAKAKLSPTAEIANVLVNDNRSTIHSVGASPSVLFRPARGLQIGGSLSYSYTRRDGEQLAVIPPLFGNARIAWQPLQDGVTIAAAAIITGARRVTAEFTPTDIHIGGQFDLRATLSGPTGLPGLTFRAVLSYVHNPYLPYALTTPDPNIQAGAVPFFPVTSRLFGFVGLRYDLPK